LKLRPCFREIGKGAGLRDLRLFPLPSFHVPARQAQATVNDISAAPMFAPPTPRPPNEQEINAPHRKRAKAFAVHLIPRSNIASSINLQGSANNNKSWHVMRLAVRFDISTFTKPGLRISLGRESKIGEHRADPSE
jgi:hypothetical protein